MNMGRHKSIMRMCEEKKQRHFEFIYADDGKLKSYVFMTIHYA